MTTALAGSDGLFGFLTSSQSSFSFNLLGQICSPVVTQLSFRAEVVQLTTDHFEKKRKTSALKGFNVDRAKVKEKSIYEKAKVPKNLLHFLQIFNCQQILPIANPNSQNPPIEQNGLLFEAFIDPLWDDAALHCCDQRCRKNNPGDSRQDRGSLP